MTEYVDAVMINGKEYVPVSTTDEYDFEYIYFTPKEEWDALVEKYKDIDFFELWYAHRIGVREYGELTEYIEEEYLEDLE